MPITAELLDRVALAPVYRLADHLDAALAIGEDLMRTASELDALQPGDGAPQIAARHGAIADFAAAVRGLELALVSRVMLARTRAAEARSSYPRFEPLIALFIGGTAQLADAVAEGDGIQADRMASALADGADLLKFLRERNICEDAARTLAGVDALHIREDFLVSGLTPLGLLMDMIAQFLDTLDLAFELYAEPRPDLTMTEVAAALP